MIDLFGWLKGRLAAEYNESGGVNIALQTIERFKDRTFKFKAAGMKHRNMPAKEIMRFIKEELPAYYTYTTKIKTFTDINRTEQAHIVIKGTLGITGRYNPLDRSFTIKTENTQT